MSGNFLEYLADLAVFAKVVETRGFSAAARHIGLTKSSVSKQVSRLEQGLGVRLLHRTTRALSLTEAGRVLYEGAAQSVSLAEEAQAAVAQLSVAPRGTLRITTSVAFGKLCVAPLIPEFLATYPEVRIQLVLLDRIVDLAEEGFDLAIRLTRKLPDQVVAKKLMTIPYVTCASPAYLAGRKRIRAPADLAAHDCLYYGAGGLGDTWIFDGRNGRQTVRVAGRLEVNSSEVIRDALLADLGVGLLPVFAVARELEQGRLKKLLPAWLPQGPFGSAAYAVWLPNRHLPPKVRAFVDFVEGKWRRVGGSAKEHVKA